MHPLTVELLSKAEKYHRSEQVKACQLRNQAYAARSSRANLLARVRNGLGTLLANVGQRLYRAERLIGQPGSQAESVARRL